jgi:hypothetical protein
MEEREETCLRLVATSRTVVVMNPDEQILAIAVPSITL